MLLLLTYSLHLPSARLLAATVAEACAALNVPADGWLEPEDAAEAAARAVSAIRLPAADDDDDQSALPPLPPQGEFAFATDDHASRAATVEEAAFGGCSRAQHTLGLLTFGGVGGCEEADLRGSAYWHAAAAAQGNLDALATLGGCVRRGAGVAQDEAAGVALIEAAAAAGSPCGLCKLGVLHDEGTLPGGSAHPTEGARLFARAAEGGGSALGLFHHGWALVHGIGAARDVEAGMRAWRAATDLAPDDGAEEAAYHLYKEQRQLPPPVRKLLRPDDALRLSAALEFEPAVKALRRRLSPEAAERAAERRRRRRDGGATKERFVRNDKARAMTSSEARALVAMDDDL